MPAIPAAISPARLAQMAGGREVGADGRESYRYKRNAFVNLLNEELLDVAEGKCKKLAVFAPPRHGKTRLLTEVFAAYYLGRFPRRNVIVASHSATLASKFGRNVRDLMIEFGHLFGVKVADDRRAADNWGLTDGGGMLSIGVGGSLVGFGADCFVGETLVETAEGAIEIQHLCRLQYKPDVLAYDHENGTLVWRRVVASRVIQADAIYEVRTKSGRVLRCTGDHRFFVPGQGYKAASLLRAGDPLVSAKVPVEQALRSVRGGEGRSRHQLPQVLRRDSGQDPRHAGLHALREDLLAAPVRAREVGSQRHGGRLLLGRVLPVAPRHQESAEVQALFATHPRQEQGLLLRSLPEESSPEAADDLPPVQRRVRAQAFADSVLRQGVRERPSLGQDGRDRQLALQGRQELRGVVQADAPADPGTRRFSLRGLLGGGGVHRPVLEESARPPVQPDRASHRREADEQHARELGRALPDVPCGPPQVGEDSVDVVRRLRDGQVPVYDIQVEGTSNFFAGQVLVHNCFIFDDIIADSAAALSETVRNSTMDWYESTAETRINAGGAQIFTMQRWHDYDPARRVVFDHAKDWRIINLPAIADHDPARGETDPLGRQPGEALWPERWPVEVLREMQARKAFWFAAQYQQRPVPRGGGMIQREWVEKNVVYSRPDSAEERVRFWDRAATENGGDYTVGVLMARQDGEYVVEDVVRGQWGSTRRDSIILQTCHEDNLRYPNAVTTWGEQEPGSSGKDMALAFEKMLRPFAAHCKPSTGSKEVRADGMAGAFGRGEVHVRKGNSPDFTFDWYESLLDELTTFPYAKHDDVVDACSGAFNLLSLAVEPGGYATADDSGAADYLAMEDAA
jgi:predicted phage terminase large subunit-like protein